MRFISQAIFLRQGEVGRLGGKTKNEEGMNLLNMGGKSCQPDRPF